MSTPSPPPPIVEKVPSVLSDNGEKKKKKKKKMVGTKDGGGGWGKGFFDNKKESSLKNKKKIGTQVGGRKDQLIAAMTTSPPPPPLPPSPSAPRQPPHTPPTDNESMKKVRQVLTQAIFNGYGMLQGSVEPSPPENTAISLLSHVLHILDSNNTINDGASEVTSTTTISASHPLRDLYHPTLLGLGSAYFLENTKESLENAEKHLSRCVFSEGGRVDDVDINENTSSGMKRLGVTLISLSGETGFWEFHTMQCQLFIPLT